MSTSAIDIEPVAVVTDATPAYPSRPHRLCAVLTVGCIVAIRLAAGVGNPETFLRVDPSLATLLRGMALIKGGMIVAALALLAWRFRSPITGRLVAGYMASVWVATAATVMIWQLSLLPLAAASFHLALLAALVLAWRDGGEHFSTRMAALRR